MFNKVFFKGSNIWTFKNLIIVIFLVLPLISRAVDITINPNQPNGITYCASPVYISPDFTMDPALTITGMKVSISLGYIPGEDELRYVGKVGSVVGMWDATMGYIKLIGGANINEYIAAMKQIQYVNKAVTPTNKPRILIFSLDDIDYLPETQHFYRFISNKNMSWTAARNEAEGLSMRYHGLQGYLATITSAAENAFIQQKTQGVGWIGASDAAVEGEWRWVTGPEGQMDSGKGLLFWKGTGYQAKTDPVNYGAVNGAYQNWNRWNQPYTTSLAQTTWEPNQSGNEDYAHITVFPTNPADSYKWNDLPDIGGSGDYVSAGYLIEYGGMPGDPTISLLAGVNLNINTIYFAPVANRNLTICQYDTIHLNQPETTSSYQWTPAIGLSNTSISNPIAKPNVSTIYSVTATKGLCKDSATFIVTVKPAPIGSLKDVEDICAGKKVTLFPGMMGGFQWDTGELTPSITTGKAGLHTVTLTGFNGCKSIDSVLVAVHQYPKLDLSRLNLVTCGTTATTLNISSDKGSIVLTNKYNYQIFQGTNVSVPWYGDFPFNALVTDPFGCTVDTTVTLRFHKIPKVDLTINETVCYGYSLQASYLGDATIPVSRFTWIFGGDTVSNKLGQVTEQIPLGANQSKRDLVLNVTEDGCTGSNSLKDILVIPDLKLFVKKSLQCQPVPFDFWATNTENVVQYDWNFSDGLSGTGKALSHSFAKDGYYDVMLTVTTDKGCTNTANIKKMVYVAPIPTVQFSIPSGVCLNPGKDTLTFTGSADKMDTYYWDLKGFDPAEIVQSPDTTAGPLIFNLLNKPKTTLSLYVISQYGCRSTTEYLEVKRRPVFTFSPLYKDGCTPLEVRFNAKAGDPVDQLNFYWEFGDGNSGTGASTNNIYYVPNRDYDYKLNVFSSLTGCSDSIFKPKSIVVYPIPTVAFSIPSGICLNPGKDTLKYIGSGNNKDTYFWNLKGFDPAEIVQSPDSTAGPLIFDLRNKPKTTLSLYVISQYGCRSTTESLEVKRRPLFTFSPSIRDGCTPMEVKFRALAGDPVDQLIYRWDFGDGNKGAGASVSNTYLVPNRELDIRLNVSSSLTGCSDSIFQPKYIVVHPNPVAGFSMDRSLVYNDNPVVNFTDQSVGAENIYWDFGDGKHSRLKDPKHSFEMVGRRKVLQSVYNQFECLDTTSKTVLVAFNRIFAPNAFSPNANTHIDRTFLLTSAGIIDEGYHLVIISRWNDVVFECRNEIKGWDGRTMKGDYAPAGNYIWILECTDFLGLPHRQTGSLTLVY